jgi:8-amino-7-oxononanoate synthase
MGLLDIIKKRKSLWRRCASDPVTKLRLRYDPYYHAAEEAQGVRVRVDGRPMVMMSSNEYLGLSLHPRVVAAAQKAALQWGTSSCGSRLANGSRAYHEELEEELAVFLGMEACHVLTAGYLACMSSVSCIAQRGDAVIVDRSIHSALWDGVRLSAATIERFAHNDPADLERVLRATGPETGKVVVVDGVYSMEGHIAPLEKISELARELDAFLVVDDAHGLGVLGREGRGVCDHCGVTGDVDLVAGSFSKSLASTGGFVAGDREVIEFLRTHSKQIIFSAALTPMASAAAREALVVMQEEPQHRERLWENTRYFSGLLQAEGFDTWNSPTPAMPIVIGDTEKAFRIWKGLWDEGFFTVISTSPGVPAGKDLLRCAVSALHQREDLERFVDVLKRLARR